MNRRRFLRWTAIAATLFSLVTGVSVVRYVLAHPNEPLQQNLASWAREQGLGGIVDQLEVWLHDEPPSAAPANSLALAVDEAIDDGSDAPASDSSSTTVPPVPTTGASTAPSPVSPTTIEASTPAVTNPNAKPVKLTACGTPATTTTTVPGQSTTTRPSTTSTTSTSTTTTSTSTTTTTVPPPTVPGETTTTSTSTTTTTTIPARPADIDTPITPALRGEGEWRPAIRVRKVPIVHVSSIRPIARCGSVVATMAAFNPNLVRAALHNGEETPGGGPWRNKDRVSDRARPSLIASFNGGFRFDHKPGGYVTEGKVVRKLRKGYATLGIRADGTSTVGVWGEDMIDDGSWVSLRQNLPPLVRGGEIVFHTYDKVDWGKDYDDKVFNFRSAVCRRTDGLMMFVAVGDVSISMLAETMVLLSCDTAMEMDINGTWPYFAVYENFGKDDRRGRVIDTRMGDPNRHLNKSTKDFIALFDPETLPPGAVR
ncbi:MAG: phosphodiester glycosidase family protein [Actinomycetota bacterium]